MSITPFPKHGRSRPDILAHMQTLRQRDLNWQEGKVFSLVFYAGEEANQVIHDAYNLFFSENGLNPTAFPSLRQFETEVVGMSAALLGGDGQVVGNMTSGGTESILMTVLTAREWAKTHKPHVQQPEIVLPLSAHPAFAKAAHYFGVNAVRTPVGADLRADVTAVTQAITPNTILIVGSAPSYPHGVVDPIAELAALAQQHEILCHVDACVGGFMLPFVQKLGYAIPDFDFRVPGVTSISADLHKYGYAAKGASLILYRNRDIRRHQLFADTDWPGGIYASPTMAGTRPGGAIAAAWAIMQHLGEEGYVQIARQVMETAVALRQGIAQIPGLKVLGDPPMSLMAIGSDDLNVYEVGDEMGLRGWHLDRQQFPPSLHLTVNYAHIHQKDAFLQDLAAAAAAARKPALRKLGNSLILGAARTATRILPAKWVSRLTGKASGLVGASGDGLPQRSAAMYGMMGSLPNRGDLHEVVLDLVEQFTEAADGKP
ncbi:MAG: aspartate aminotransferase family protein [Chloroflexota bacterium]